MDVKHIIEPERQGLWIAATFIIALLALALSFASLKRVSNLTYVTQTEALLLNKKIDKTAGQATPATAPAPAAPAATGK